MQDINQNKQQLLQLRSSGKMSDDALVDLYKKQDLDFASRYNETLRKKLSFKNQAGETVPTATASLNYYLYGNPYGEKGDVSNQPLRGQGYFQNIAERFQRGFGNDAVRAGRSEVKGLENGFLGAVKDLPGDIADVAGKALPFLAGTAAATAAAPAAITGVGVAGMAGAAGLGFAGGEMARQSIGDMMGVNQKYGQTTEDKASFSSEEGQGKALEEVAIEGASGAAGEMLGLGMIGGGKIAMKSAKNLLIKGGAVMTNVGDDVLRRAFDQPKMMSEAIRKFSENPKQPFLSLAKDIYGKMTSSRSAAKKAFSEAAEEFKNTNTKFDASVPIESFEKTLAKFNIKITKPRIGETKKSIFLDQFGNQMDSVLNNGKKSFQKLPELSQGDFEPLKDTELQLIRKTIEKFTNAKAIGPDDLLDISKFFGKQYDEVPYSELGEPKLYHKIIMEIKNIADEKVASNLPEAMGKAYADLAKTATTKTKFGKYFIKGKGKNAMLSDNAEGFLMRMNNMNKGQQREAMKELSDALGIDIASRAELLSDAGKLTELFPSTGGRSLDIIRSLLISRLGSVSGGFGGFVLGGVPGAITGMGLGAMATVASSPAAVGGVTRGLGSLAKNKTAQSLGKIIQSMAPEEAAALSEIIQAIYNTTTKKEKKIPGQGSAGGVKRKSLPAIY